MRYAGAVKNQRAVQRQLANPDSGATDYVKAQANQIKAIEEKRKTIEEEGKRLASEWKARNLERIKAARSAARDRYSGELFAVPLASSFENAGLELAVFPL